MNNEKLYEKFAKIYIWGTACKGCEYEHLRECSSIYKKCAERIKELIEDLTND